MEVQNTRDKEKIPKISSNKENTDYSQRMNTANGFGLLNRNLGN